MNKIIATKEKEARTIQRIFRANQVGQNVRQIGEKGERYNSYEIGIILLEIKKRYSPDDDCPITHDRIIDPLVAVSYHQIPGDIIIDTCEKESLKVWMISRDQQGQMISSLKGTSVPIKYLYDPKIPRLLSLETYQQESLPSMSLLGAVSRGNLTAVRALLEQDTSQINEVNDSGYTPLMMACYYGHEECVRLLLDHGARVNAARSDGATPLLVACARDHEACARLLLDIGKADVNLERDDGATPLYVACEQGRLECVRLLLDHGAGVNATDKEGWIPLYVAYKEGHFKCARLVLAYTLKNSPFTKRAIIMGFMIAVLAYCLTKGKTEEK